MKMALAAGCAALALILTVSPRSAAAAASVHALGLPASAFPAGAFITHEHVDRTAAQVSAEGVVGSPNTQGAFYQRLGFMGSLFESARLPSFDGAARELWLLATMFPSAAVAQQALSGDTRFSQCDLSPVVSRLGGAVTCAYINAQGPESGMYVAVAAGRVEFIVLGFVHDASTAARSRAIRDASFLAVHEALHVKRVMSVS